MPASVSTDMMDSFIDGMNPRQKAKRRSKSSRLSDAGFTHPVLALAHAAPSSPASNRSQRRSGSDSPGAAAAPPDRSSFGLARAPADVRSNPGMRPSQPAVRPFIPPASAQAASCTPQSPPAHSIDEIIRRNKAISPHAFAPARSRHAVPRLASQGPLSFARPLATVGPLASDLHAVAAAVEDEVVQSLHLLAQLEKGKVGASSTEGQQRQHVGRDRSGPAVRPSVSPTSNSKGTEPRNTSQENVAGYLRSHRLTRVIALRRPQVPGQVVSLADVGDPTGYPVMVFLGLGSVRYLVALFDEIAQAHAVRLICVDRPGLGKSTEVPAERRGVAEWAEAIGDVADQLGMGRFAILAHSAGVPYALAAALHMPRRVMGDIHLLAPWVNKDISGGECM